MDKNKKIGLIAAIVPLFAFGMAFAGVPLYKMFCEQTGYGGTIKAATKSASKITKDEIRISFDANVSPELPVSFEPEKTMNKVKLGANTLEFYKITNNSDKTIVAIANYNVAPFKAAKYFSKLQCFCFADQTLKPGESLQLPVIFYVDPEIANDELTKDVKDITLSYTFFESKKFKNQQVSGTSRPKGA